MEVYVDDMLLKSKNEMDHMAHLSKAFDTMRRYGMKLNPKKCTFGVHGGKFLGYMVTQRGIEANPEKIDAILKMESPKTVRDVQALTGKMASLSRFISRSADKGLPFFKILCNIKKFEWTDECEGEQLFLYLAVTNEAVSAVLTRCIKGDHRPVYYVSKMMQGAEKNYTKVEKWALALMIASRKLRPYFQSHHIVVLTDQPLKQILARPDVSGRLVKWAVELGEFSIEYKPRTTIKAQVLAEFIVEMSTTTELSKVTTGSWMLHVDGSSMIRRGGIGVWLRDPRGNDYKYAIKLDFEVTNNEAEYEALIAGLEMAIKEGLNSIDVYTDSQLVANQIAGTYETREEKLVSYLEKVKELMKSFSKIEILQVPREENERADALSKGKDLPRPWNVHNLIHYYA